MEIIIERWVEPGGATDYLWSVWDAGRRLQMGGRFDSAEAAEAAARAYCLEAKGREPERVRLL